MVKVLIVKDNNSFKSGSEHEMPEQYAKALVKSGIAEITGSSFFSKSGKTNDLMEK